MRRRLLLAAICMATALGSAACSPWDLQPQPHPVPADPGCATAATTETAPPDSALPDIRLTSAALLSITVTVDAQRTAHPQCITAQSGTPVHLHIGDRIQLIANSPPRISPDGVLTVTTAPGPTTTGPGGLATEHLLVTLTATTPGQATVRWFNCSGTGC